MTLPEALKRFRKEFKVTQKQAAKVVGVTERAYQNYETDKTEIPAAALLNIADAYGLSLDYLAGRSDAPKPAVAPVAIDKATIDELKRDLYAEIDQRIAQRFPYVVNAAAI